MEEILVAAEKLRADIAAERSRSGKLHMAGALHMTDRYLEYVIADLKRHQLCLNEEEE